MVDRSPPLFRPSPRLHAATAVDLLAFLVYVPIRSGDAPPVPAFNRHAWRSGGASFFALSLLRRRRRCGIIPAFPFRGLRGESRKARVRNAQKVSRSTVGLIAAFTCRAGFCIVR